MLGIITDNYFYQQNYSSLKFKNVVKFCVHISPIFSCPVTYYLNGIPLSVVNHCKYLGIIIQSDLNWNKHVGQKVSIKLIVC